MEPKEILKQLTFEKGKKYIIFFDPSVIQIDSLMDPVHDDFFEGMDIFWVAAYTLGNVFPIVMKEGKEEILKFLEDVLDKDITDDNI